MENTERYATSLHRKREGEFKSHCSRTRCNNDLDLFVEHDDMNRTSYRYLPNTIVVSVMDGTWRYAFCSPHCAVLWLTSNGKHLT